MKRKKHNLTSLLSCVFWLCVVLTAIQAWSVQVLPPAAVEDARLMAIFFGAVGFIVSKIIPTEED